MCLGGAQSLRRELGMVKEDVRVTILSMPQMAGQMMLPLEALAEQLIEQHRALQSRCAHLECGPRLREQNHGACAGGGVLERFETRAAPLCLGLCWQSC